MSCRTMLRIVAVIGIFFENSMNVHAKSSPPMISHTLSVLTLVEVFRTNLSNVRDVGAVLEKVLT